MKKRGDMKRFGDISLYYLDVKLRAEKVLAMQMHSTATENLREQGGKNGRESST